MAALSNTVDPGSGASGDYASLNALEGAQEQDLTDGGGDTYTAINTTTGDNAADTTATTFVGWTTGAANFISVEAASGDQAIKTGWDASRYRLSVTGDTVLIITEAYVRIDGLQIEVDPDANDERAILVNDGVIGNDIRISNCRIRCLDTDGTFVSQGIVSGDDEENVKIWNCIITGFLAATWGAAIIDINSNTLGIYNNILYNNEVGIFRQDGTWVAKNNAVFKNTNDFNGTITVDYCASDDNDGTNNVAESGGGADWPDDFVDAANGDFTLKATSNLAGAGINDPGSGLYSTDIEGDNYVVDSWSLGVDELVGAPPAGIVVLRRRRAA